MRGFFNPEERVPSVLMLCAVLLLLGSLLFMVFAPRPGVQGLVAKRRRSLQQLDDQIESLKKRTVAATAATRPRLMIGEPEQLTAQILGRVTQAAQVRQLSLGAFRPQRQKALPGLIELPYSVQLRGKFPAVRAFLSDLDAPGSKLVVRSLQLAASDGDSSIVTATVGLSIYTENANSDASSASKNSTSNREESRVKAQ